jgi:hypothetical protein
MINWLSGGLMGIGAKMTYKELQELSPKECIIHTKELSWILQRDHKCSKVSAILNYK